MDYYKLINKTPVKCSYDEYHSDITSQDRLIKLTLIERYKISTAFLGVNHEFRRERPPMLFETAIFDLTAERETKIYDRYSTYQDAEIGHDLAVAGMLIQICDVNQWIFRNHDKHT